MINISELTKKDFGKWVVYKPELENERGRIKSFNFETIFVVYHCDNNWEEFQNYTAAGTDPEDLFWEK